MRPLPKRKDCGGFARTSIPFVLHSSDLPSQNPDCVLCARPKRDREKKALYPLADSFLRVCKPTEGQGWVHLACAVFVPEVTFSDAKRLRVVEGISTIPAHRWSTVRNSPT
jgi:PHD-zinc-finger like domain